jgi:hypothetical protein
MLTDPRLTLIAACFYIAYQTVAALTRTLAP